MERICACEENHNIPISDTEITTRLEELWSQGFIEVSDSFSDLVKEDSFLEAHLTPQLWADFANNLSDDICLYGERHRLSTCTTGCGE